MTRSYTRNAERASPAAIFRSRRYHIRASLPNMVNRGGPSFSNDCTARRGKTPIQLTVALPARLSVPPLSSRFSLNTCSLGPYDWYHERRITAAPLRRTRPFLYRRSRRVYIKPISSIFLLPFSFYLTTILELSIKGIPFYAHKTFTFIYFFFLQLSHI